MDIERKGEGGPDSVSRECLHERWGSPQAGCDRRGRSKIVGSIILVEQKRRRVVGPADYLYQSQFTVFCVYSSRAIYVRSQVFVVHLYSRFTNAHKHNAKQSNNPIIIIDPVGMLMMKAARRLCLALAVMGITNKTEIAHLYIGSIFTTIYAIYARENDDS